MLVLLNWIEMSFYNISGFMPIKQEGGSCGSCFNPDINNHCGICAEGLECIKDHAIMDAPGQCRKKIGML